MHRCFHIYFFTIKQTILVPTNILRTICHLQLAFAKAR
ncbi:hypothetical protein JCM19275_1244 [Nonlabens ulvanivorans]|uniref:Uncharacterized protein n=1 Tax=Nonlabens ulvanivorans TaxID=906888 RepID=A0A090X3R7_NONUL|nr:hypothetical protein JCM19275_1244 [Nonlabens ulvanivorans]